MQHLTDRQARKAGADRSSRRSIIWAPIFAFVLVMAACSTDDGTTTWSTGATSDPSPTVAFSLLDPTPESAASTATSHPAPTATQAPTGPTPAPAEPAPERAETPRPDDPIEFFQPHIIATYPHDNTAYTQGLEIYQGKLLESTGRQGHPGGDEVYESDLRLIDITSGEIERRVDVPGTVFAEGLTRVGDELVQITWKDQRVFWYDADTLELKREASYAGDGWGLCYDGTRLIMTDGSANLFFRDPVSFELLGSVPVTRGGEALPALNELECLDGDVWANIYRTNMVVRVHPDTGIVTGVVDASALEQPRVPPTEVLNGLAWDDETDTWLMTGKFWSTMYRVEFVSAGEIDPTG